MLQFLVPANITTYLCHINYKCIIWRVISGVNKNEIFNTSDIILLLVLYRFFTPVAVDYCNKISTAYDSFYWLIAILLSKWASNLNQRLNFTNLIYILHNKDKSGFFRRFGNENNKMIKVRGSLSIESVRL